VVRSKPAAPSESVLLSDFAECLLQAYDGVARRAYQKYAARGYKRGRDNEDWLAAQKEVGFQMRVDGAESEKFVHAMVVWMRSTALKFAWRSKESGYWCSTRRSLPHRACRQHRLMRWNGIRKLGAQTRCETGRGLGRALDEAKVLAKFGAKKRKSGRV
jgi:hypothetical protein